MLRQLLEQVTGLSLQQKATGASHVVELEDEPPDAGSTGGSHKNCNSDGHDHRGPTFEEPDTRESKQCAKLMAAISRLCSIVPANAASGASQRALDGLLEVLETLRSAEFLDSVVLSKMLDAKECSHCSRLHIQDLMTGLGSVYGALLSVGRVGLNEPSMYPTEYSYLDL